MTKYEIWNEQNTDHFWRGQADAPEYYAELYLAARAAIKAVDPDARVIVGGLALENTGVTDPDDFVTRMYRHRPELAGNVDAIGFHPYTPDVDGVYIKLREIRATLSRVGAGDVPLELTELGWTTTTASESHRAESLARLADELPRSDCNVASLAPHTWVTDEKNAADGEDWFGIYNLDATPKPSGSAYLGSVQRVRSGAVSGPLSICSPAQPASRPRSAPVRARRPLVVLHASEARWRAPTAPDRDGPLPRRLRHDAQGAGRLPQAQARPGRYPSGGARSPTAPGGASSGSGSPPAGAWSASTHARRTAPGA